MDHITPLLPSRRALAKHLKHLVAPWSFCDLPVQHLFELESACFKPLTATTLNSKSSDAVVWRRASGSVRLKYGGGGVKSKVRGVKKHEKGFRAAFSQDPLLDFDGPQQSRGALGGHTWATHRGQKARLWLIAMWRVEHTPVLRQNWIKARMNVGRLCSNIVSIRWLSSSKCASALITMPRAFFYHRVILPSLSQYSV